MEITLLNADAMEISPFNICVKCFKVGAVQLHAHFCHFELSYSFFSYICTNLFLPILSTPVQADPDLVPTHCCSEPTSSQSLQKETTWVETCWKFNLSLLLVSLVKNKWEKMFKYVLVAQADWWTFWYKHGNFSPKVFTTRVVTTTSFCTMVHTNQ